MMFECLHWFWWCFQSHTHWYLAEWLQSLVLNLRGYDADYQSWAKHCLRIRVGWGVLNLCASIKHSHSIATVVSIVSCNRIHTLNNGVVFVHYHSSTHHSTHLTTFVVSTILVTAPPSQNSTHKPFALSLSTRMSLLRMKVLSASSKNLYCSPFSIVLSGLSFTVIFIPVME